MSEKKQPDFYAWVQACHDFDLTAWERLPDIDLYMDQVVGYLDKLLSLQDKREDAPVLTASMINNYVKAGYIPRPNQKRYNRAHLAALYILSSAKQNLSVPDAAALLSMLHDYCGIDAIYTTYGERQREIAEDLTSQITADPAPSPEELLNLALDLTIRSAIEKQFAEHIIDRLRYDRDAAEAIKGKDKEKSKVKEQETDKGIISSGSADTESPVK